jgi:hypothetical protein
MFRLDRHAARVGDIIAQMSTAAISRNAAIGLFPEFVEGGITHKKTVKGDGGVFASPERPAAQDARRSTRTRPSASTRTLGGAYNYAQAHFGGSSNLYMDAVKQNIRFVERTNSGGNEIPLRRKPPVTIN